jgi:hypothetical protein
MRQAKRILFLVMLLTMTASAKRRDPLTAAEIQQLREAAAQPQKRLGLYLKFADARLLAIDQLCGDPKLAEGRGKKIHDLLEDFTAILDEINDNLDTYEGRPLKDEDRKYFKMGLKDVVEASDKFDLKLRALQSAAKTDPEIKKEAADFQFVLRDAEDALKSTGDMAREYLKEKDEEKRK